jgi:hypothetical protein
MQPFARQADRGGWNGWIFPTGGSGVQAARAPLTTIFASKASAIFACAMISIVERSKAPIATPSQQPRENEAQQIFPVIQIPPPWFDRAWG